MSSKSRSFLLLPIVFLVLVGCLAVQVRKKIPAPPPLPVTQKSPESILTVAAEPSPLSTAATKHITAPTPSPVSTGTLVVEFVYTGEWYRETFNYQPTAPNIRHIVLVMPEEGEVILSSPGWVFSTLMFTPYPEPFVFRPEVTEYVPLLAYLHDAYAGLAEVVLEPGRYKVAVAFIAEALPPPDGDAILYPGVTGGGASNEFHTVEVRAGEITHVIYELTDENGWGAVNILSMK